MRGSNSEVSGLQTDPTENCLLCSEIFTKTDSIKVSYESDVR